MIDDLDTSSRGIWVFPYDAPAAGPSKSPRSVPRKLSRPDHLGLGEIYQSSLQAYRSAYEEYEDKRTEEQLDDITDWLDSCSSSSSSVAKSQFHRLPVAILQNPAKQVHSQIKTISSNLEVVSIQGRDMIDLGTGIKGITAGFLGLGGAEVPPKSGLTGLDLVEGWWRARRNPPTLVLHVQDAQVVHLAVLAEIMYILCLHPALPIRLLLSVPSSSTFLSQWPMIEPSSLDLTILSSPTRGRRKQTVLSEMLDAGGNEAVITVGDELAEALRGEEALYGQGPEGALKAIQWSMLHHSANSALASTTKAPGESQQKEQEQEHLAAIRRIMETIKSDRATPMPGRELFQLRAERDLSNVTDPAPRISIIQALSNPSLFTRNLPARPKPGPQSDGNDNAQNSTLAHPAWPQTTPRKPSKRRKPSPSPDGETNGSSTVDDQGDLKDLETLFGLWKGAGKNVNLWDWLQGYRNTMAGENVNDNDQEEGDEDEGKTKMRARPDQAEAEIQVPASAPTREVEVNEDRLHATFVRFCEEARMLGLVRARGKAVGRKADEVVKGVTLI